MYVVLLIFFSNGMLTSAISPRPDQETADNYIKQYQNLSHEYDLSEVTPCDGTPYNCSYNGKCVNNICVCKPQWMGPHCAILNLKPTNKTYGYQYMIDNQRVSSWGYENCLVLKYIATFTQNIC